MASNYHSILEDNLHEYGHGKRHLAFLGRLYTDRTHFVYELLQNAEDAEATRVEFLLYDDHLLFRHDGRIFDEADVRGLCGVGDSTKQEDLTKIGKFGVGFKSVYALTATPKVHSGDEHFQIDEYIRPCAIESVAIEEPWTTLFCFPFDHDEVPSQTAFEDISHRLANLGLRSLLFLDNLVEIRWRIGDAASGWFNRDSVPLHQGKHVLIVGESDGESYEENWLVYKRSVRVPVRTTEVDRVDVEIAYQLEQSDSGEYGIVRCEDTDLVVFFPTEKPTNLGFLMQGPYRTTPARDNIPRDDSWNCFLVTESAELVADSLRILRDCGLLDTNVLLSLPIQANRFPEASMFRPVFDRVREAFRSECLLPAAEGGTVRAGSAVLARGAGLRQLLSSEQLAKLLQLDSPKTLSGNITQDRTPTLREYLINQLDVLEITPETLARRVTETFFDEQSDEWMATLYEFLLSQEALWEKSGRREGGLRQKPFIRLTDGSHVPPFGTGGTPNAYLPSEYELDVPTVKPNLAADEKARELFDRLGFYEPDLSDRVITSILPKYSGHITLTELETTEYETDLKAIVAALKTDSTTKRERAKSLARRTPFLKAFNVQSENVELRSPASIYRYSEQLEEYFASKPDTWFLVRDQQLFAIVGDSLNDLGVATGPRKIEFDPDFDWAERSRLRQNDGSSRGETLRDYEIDGLAEALAQISSNTRHGTSRRLSSVIWHILIELMSRHSDDDLWHGRYSWFYYYPKSCEFEASFLRRLKASKWLPSESGEFKPPNEIDVSKLPEEEFPHHPSLIDHLGIRDLTVEEENKQSQYRELAEQLGVKISDIELMKDNWDEFVNWRDTIKSRDSFKPSFPDRTPSEPARREERIVRTLRSAPRKSYNVRERSVRTTTSEGDPRVWLRTQYTNDDGQMVCQMCEDEMPFRGRSGEPYFEAVESTANCEFEHRAIHLALCPVCAAKFKEFIKRDSNASSEFEGELLASSDACIRLKLGGQFGQLRFVETHILDLRAVLRENNRVTEESGPVTLDHA